MDVQLRALIEDLRFQHEADGNFLVPNPYNHNERVDVLLQVLDGQAAALPTESQQFYNPRREVWIGPSDMLDPPGLNLTDFIFASPTAKVTMAPIHIHLPELGSTSGFTEVTTIGCNSTGALVISRRWE